MRQAGGPGPQPRAATQDTRLTTRSGASLVIPKGWIRTEGPSTIAAESPDRLLRVTFHESDDPDAAAAISAAWRSLQPAAMPVPAGDLDARPPTGGWDAMATLEYEGQGQGRRPVSALARRYERRMYVALLEADPGALDRRAAELDALLGSLRPLGMKDESFAGHAPSLLSASRAEALDRFTVEALTRLEVPGAAVAVIMGGAVVYERTYGVRTLGEPAKVTRQTLFLVGSVSKPMTSMMQAALVDAGLVTWDTPVTQLLPGFAVGDADVTRKLSLWHMSCACTGMPRHDLENLFEYGNATPESHLATLRTMKPTTALGEVFQYSNAMYAAGGFAAARALVSRGSLGDAYAEAMRAKVFVPVGMPATTLDFGVVERANHASPHALTIDGRPQPLPLAIERNVLPIAPAGAVWSNLADLERFAITELNQGIAPDGKRVVSKANMLARRQVRVRSGDGSGYGLGLDIGSLQDVTIIGHDGGAFGYGTTLLLLPDLGVGLVVFSNVRNGGDYAQLPFNDVVTRRVFEALFDGAKNLSGPRLDYFVAARRKATQRARTGLERPTDTAWMAPIAGTYRHPRLGNLVLGGGRLDAGEWQTALGRRTASDGSHTLVFLDPPFAGTELAVQGDAAHPRLVIEYGPDTYAFERPQR